LLWKGWPHRRNIDRQWAVTLIGFMRLYALLGLLFTVLVYREIDHGPQPDATLAAAVHAD